MGKSKPSFDEPPLRRSLRNRAKVLGDSVHINLERELDCDHLLEVVHGPVDGRARKSAPKKQVKKKSLVRVRPILVYSSHWSKQTDDRDGRGLDRKDGRGDVSGGIPVVAVTDEPRRRPGDRRAVVSHPVRSRSEYCIVAK